MDSQQHTQSPESGGGMTPPPTITPPPLPVPPPMSTFSASPATARADTPRGFGIPNAGFAAPQSLVAPVGPPQQPEPRLFDPTVSSGDRLYCTMIHGMGAVVALVHIISLGIVSFPLAIIPLVLWLVRRNDSEFIDDHGREAVNFQISLIVYTFLSWVLFIIGVGVLLAWGLGFFGVAASLLAANSANKGEYFRYPACLRPIKPRA